MYILDTLDKQDILDTPDTSGIFDTLDTPDIFHTLDTPDIFFTLDTPHTLDVSDTSEIFKALETLPNHIHIGHCHKERLEKGVIEQCHFVTSSLCHYDTEPYATRALWTFCH